MHQLTPSADVRGDLSLRLPASVATGKASLHIAPDGRTWKTLPIIVD